ncbi:MAG: hypothetical protein LBJ67_12430 [Planctomycetaceae bacterium]|jgi:hypothetical protein|nr:hypothetical protein [Planctomycetaceae bacterium]
MKTTFTIFNLTMFFLIAAFSCGGCSSITSKMSLPSFSNTKHPTQIIATWETVIRQEGSKTIRGCAARVMFYDSSVSSKALKVRGDFDVYAYDEDAPNPNNTEPTRVIRFCPDNLKHLETNSKLLGASYTLWVPWDELTQDSEEKKVSLFVKFRCDDGNAVLSNQATMKLPSMKTDSNASSVVKNSNPYIENKLRQMALLEDLSVQRQMNSSSTNDVAWTNQVQEYVISRDVRPEAMVTTTINRPHVWQNGSLNVTSQRSYASANDAQKQQADILLANANMRNNVNQPNPNIMVGGVQTNANTPLYNNNFPANNLQNNMPINNVPLNNMLINSVPNNNASFNANGAW